MRESGPIPQGTRNQAVFTEACRLRRQGLDGHTLPPALHDVNRTRCNPPLPASDIDRIARNVVAQYPAGPAPVAVDPDSVGTLAAVRGWKRQSLVEAGAEAYKYWKHEAVRIPMRRADGTVTTWQYRRADGGKFSLPDGREMKAMSKRRGKLALFLSSWPLPPDGVVLLVEGATDLFAARSAGAEAVVGLPSHSPGKTVLGHAAELLRGRDIIAAIDADAGGAAFVRNVREHVEPVAASVRAIPPDATDGKDIDDRLSKLPEADRPARLRELLDSSVPISEVVVELPAEALHPWPPYTDVIDMLAPPPPEPFPVDALAGARWLRDMVVAVEQALDVPVDAPALFALAVVATCVQRSTTASPRPGWSEQLSLFVAVSMAPGERKSAILREVLRPLADFESSENRNRAPDIAQAEERVRVMEERLKKARTDVAKGKGKESDAVELAAAIAEEKAKLPRRLNLYGDDVTPQAIAATMESQRGAFALFSAEGGVVFANTSRYESSGAANFENVLKGHAGDPIRVIRRGADDIVIENPRLTVALAVQPSVLRDAVGRSEFRGQGLLARFLFATPAPRVGTRAARTPPIPKHVADSYAEAIERLLHLGLTAALSGRVSWTSEADAALENFQTDFEPRLHPRTGDLRHVADWGAKAGGLLVRLASLLAIARDVEAANPFVALVDVAEVRAARRIVEWGVGHLLLVFDDGGADTARDDVRRVWRTLLRQRAEVVAKQTLWQSAKSTLATADRLDAALRELEQAGAVRLHRDIPTPEGGRPSERIELHPEAVEATRPAGAAA